MIFVVQVDKKGSNFAIYAQNGRFLKIYFFSLFFYLVSGKCLKSPKNRYKSSLGYLEKSVGNRFLIFSIFAILWPPPQSRGAKIAKKRNFWAFTGVKNPEKWKYQKSVSYNFFQLPQGCFIPIFRSIGPFSRN